VNLPFCHADENVGIGACDAEYASGLGCAAVRKRQTAELYLNQIPQCVLFGEQPQRMTVQVKLLLPFHSERIQQTYVVVQLCGVNISAQLDIALLIGSHSRRKLLIGGYGFPRLRRARSHRRHRQHHHEYQQDTDGALSYVCFCHRIFSFPS